ncbi:MAG TPA: carbamoyltransferase C-terminal domain-containing protein [Longimicrobiales bacterium]
MRILGITTEGDGGAAVVDDGRILAAVNEERLCRMKLVVGFPRGAIAEVLRLSGSRPDDLDAAIIAATMSEFVDELKPFDGWFQGMRHGSGGMIKRFAGRLARYRDALPFLEAGYYTLQAPVYWSRRRSIRGILRREFELRCPILFVDHHFAHLTSAYFTSGFRDALAISIDGGGDGRSSLVYAVRDGRFEYLSETSAYDSLGNYYAYITHICGFKAQKHEGKITGLAAHGEPVHLPLLREFIDEEAGRLVNKGRVAFGGAIRELERRLPRGWTREDLAASIQAHFEDVVRRYVGHWCARTGLRDVAAAGGVFANVRVNEEVHRLEHVDRVFIHPHMGDGGLSVGAALAACVPGVLPPPLRPMRAPDGPIEDVYLGAAPATDAIASALSANGLAPEPLDAPLEERIAELLAEGYVVARADGRMEYGPRALGNRSILYQPADPSVNDWLNRNLSRTEFMPFAPSVLYEERERCFEALDGAEHPAEFMTITFHCTPWMRRHMPGVVHLDGTARPHLVRRDRNPGMYRIIEAFRERTGLPGIINTSFNMHEEPIVCTADDAVRAFLAGNLDYLAIGPFLVKHPAGVSHPLKPVRPVGAA